MQCLAGEGANIFIEQGCELLLKGLISLRELPR